MAATLVALACGAVSAGAGAEPGQPGYLTYRVMHLDTTNTISVDVDVASGNLMITERDIAREDRGKEVEVDRTYNSQAVEPSAADSALGPGWTFDVGVQTRIAYAGTTATVYGPDGYVQQLAQTPDGTYAGPPGYHGVLTHEADGTSLLADAEVKLRFDTSGQLAAVTNENGTYTVERSSLGGQAVLESYGTGDGGRARFAYEVTPRVKGFRDSAGAWHRYAYDRRGYLAGIRQPDGSSVSYDYDADGHLTRIASRPDGTVVRFVDSPTGRVRSFTVSEPREERQTTRFTYGSGSTRVREVGGIEVDYTYGTRGVVSSVTSPDATGPEAFTCVAAVPDEPGFVDPEPLEPAGLVPQATVCPPGQERQPVGFKEPHEAPAIHLPVDP